MAALSSRTNQIDTVFLDVIVDVNGLYKRLKLDQLGGRNDHLKRINRMSLLLIGQNLNFLVPIRVPNSDSSEEAI